MTPYRRFLLAVGNNPRTLRLMIRTAPALDRLMHRVTRGRFTMTGRTMPVMMLETIGSRSGLPRLSPLLCVKDGNDFLVVGSNFGQPNHPAWSTNLMKTPGATVMVRGVRTPVDATMLTGEDRDQAWEIALREWPPFAGYAERSGRELRVFRLRAR